MYDINGNILSEVVKDVSLAPDGASDPVDFGTGSNAITAKKVGLTKNADGSYSDFTVNYNGTVETAGGVSTVATEQEIFAPITKPLTDVYFVRLELDDAAGRAVSINSYAQPVKQDVMKTSSHNWSSTPQYEYADLTQLNTLPAVALDVSKSNSVDGDTYYQTVTLENKTGTIAYAINLKAYDDAGELVAPVIFSDNLFTLFPGESRTITVSYDKSAFDGVATVTWECYNNICADEPARVIPSVTGIGSKSANLAKNVTGGGSSGSIGNAVNVGGSASSAGCVAADVSVNYAIGSGAQVETAAINNTNITAAGSIKVTVTAAGMAGSPKQILVPVLSGDSGSTTATKIRTALAADAAVAAMFSVGGSSRNIVLTRLVPAENDATLNIAIDYNGTLAASNNKPTSADHDGGHAQSVYLCGSGQGHTAFDRVILRWNYTTRPGNVVVQVAPDGTAAADLSTNNPAWTVIAEQSVAETGSCVNDLLLPTAVTGRYIRVLPSEPWPAAPAVGTLDMLGGAQQSGISATAAATSYQLTAFEVYSLDDRYVVANVEPGITVSMNGGAALTSDSTIFDRTIFVRNGSDVTLDVTPTEDGVLSLFVNGGQRHRPCHQGCGRRIPLYGLRSCRRLHRLCAVRTGCAHRRARRPRGRDRERAVYQGIG